MQLSAVRRGNVSACFVHMDAAVAAAVVEFPFMLS